MHTALCTFDDRNAAEQARDRLLQAGFARDDVHLQHGHGASDAGEHAVRGNWGGLEREVAVDHRTVERIGAFFTDLFGDDHPHHATYSGAARDGRTVLVVDTHDEAGAQRARAVLEGAQPGHLNLVHRPQHRPLREIVRGGRVAAADADAVRNGAVGRSASWEDSTEERSGRAMAAEETRAAPQADDPREEPVGLRYADQRSEKPAVNRDGLGRTRRDD
ncbi:MAG TPA: hypothetical protein VFE82_06510 [Ramlibacter sp.]|jgi:hypothetical protein|uniref:hypothetical protein n=1 Tax=Ramlibacter sp. TaxID=1917967 RepID=UPI002D3AF240|nr:hypothetical protein [Ramlibacter sp.]HZY18117.1 hypothetical protein [Ramlibacter sp.]